MPHIHQSQNKVLGNRVSVTLLFESLLHISIVLVLTLFILFLQRSYCLYTDSFCLKSGWNLSKFHTRSHIYKCRLTNNISDIICGHDTIYHHTTYFTSSFSCSLAATIQNYTKNSCTWLPTYSVSYKNITQKKDAYFSKIDPYYDTSFLGLKACGFCIPSS